MALPFNRDAAINMKQTRPTLSHTAGRRGAQVDRGVDNDMGLILYSTLISCYRRANLTSYGERKLGQE